MNLPDGLHPGLSMPDYLALEAWGSSDLKAMRLGPPALVPWRRENPSGETDATRLGTAAHCAILEPARFAATYAHKPTGMNFSTTEGKAWKAARLAEGYDEKAVLAHETWVVIEQIAAAFDAKALARVSLKDAEAVEVSALALDDSTGERVKARTDWLSGGYVHDLKVSTHAVEKSLAYFAWREGWMHQLAFHRHVYRLCGKDVHGGRVVVIGPKAPHHLKTFCVEVKPDVLDLLAIENEMALSKIRECRVSGSWPGTPDDWVKVDLPPSALSESLVLTGVEEE